MTNRIEFTDATIKGLPKPTSRVTYYDAKIPGLQLRITPSGIKTFSYVYRFNGIQQRYTLRQFNSMTFTCKAARDEVKRLEGRIMAGENPAAAKRRGIDEAKAELTLGQAFQRYYEDHLIPEGKRTADALKADFNRYLGSVAPGQKKLHGRELVKSTGTVNWERRKLSAITPSDIRRMMISLKDGIGPRTANKVLVLLKAIYRRCIAWKLYGGPNPCDDPVLQKFDAGEQSRSRYLHADELPRFFTALASMDQNFQDFVQLSLYTAARRANVMGMRWQDIQWKTSTWTIPGEKSKNGEALSIPLIPAAMEILNKRRPNKDMREGFVFPTKSRTGHISPPTKQWKKLLEKADIADLRLHDLRRSTGSWMAHTGASLTIIGKGLGHRSPEATAVYARLQLDPVRESMNRAITAMLSEAKFAK